MFKIFTGNHLVEAYHREKKLKRNTNVLFKSLKLLAAIAVGIVVWALPTEVFGIEGLTLVEQRVIALFCFATMMWVTEAIPSWTTSVAIIEPTEVLCAFSASAFLV